MIRRLHTTDQVNREVSEVLTWAERLDIVLWKIDTAMDEMLWTQRERLNSLIVAVETPGICDLYSGARVSRLEREQWPGNLILGRKQTSVRAIEGNWGHEGIQQAYATTGDIQDPDILELMAKLDQHRTESRVAAGSPPSGEFRTAAASLEMVGVEDLRQLQNEEGYRVPLMWLQRDLRRAGSTHKLTVPGTCITEVLVAPQGTLACALAADGTDRWICYLSSQAPNNGDWSPTCILQLGPQEDCDLTLGIGSDRTFLLFRGRGGRAQDFGKLAAMQTATLTRSPSEQPIQTVIIAELGRTDLIRRLSDFVSQWEHDNPMPLKVVSPEPPSEIVLEGDLNEAHLQKAIAELKDGGQIRLRKAIITMRTPLAVSKSLTLQGDASSRLVRHNFQHDCGLTFEGSQAWTLEDLALEGCPIVVEGGQIGVRRCRFSNCKRAPALLVRGSTKGQVEQCRAEGNQIGIAVGGCSALVLEGNQCERNQDGICFQDESSGSARNNDCSENRQFGIKLTDQSRATLTDNRCRKNRDSGIGYSCSAAGTASGNRCEENYLSGLSAKGQAAPHLEHNQCTNNGKYGIVFAGEARGTARDNHCLENDSDGISVSDKAAPLLDRNACQKNSDDGISYYDDAGGTALENDCARNGWSGISVHNRANPTLEKNRCLENVNHSITFSGSAKGTARDNVHGPAGIWLGDQSRPTLEGNRSVEEEILEASHREKDLVEPLSVRQISPVNQASEGSLIELMESQISEATLRAALQKLSPGGCLKLGRSTIRLSDGLLIDKEIKLIGEGPEHTQLLCASEEDGVAAIELSGEGPWTIEGLSIGFADLPDSLEDDHENCCLRVDGGHIEITRCRFHGAHLAGVHIEGKTRGRLSACTVDDNQRGIHVDDHTEVLLESNQLHDNADAGLVIAGESRCVARHNEVKDNGGEGIWVGGRAHPTLEQNQCLHNGGHGIAAFGTSQPTLESNLCQKNASDGIHCAQSSQVMARHNQCLENQRHGIGVFHQASPTLEENECLKNASYDIRFEDQSTGTAFGNLSNVISKTGEACPVFRNNSCPEADQSPSAMVLFTNHGRAVYLEAEATPPLMRGEWVVASIPTHAWDESQSILACTRNGLIKKSENFALPQPGEVHNVLSSYPDDELVGVRFCDGNHTILLVTQCGQAIQFHETVVPTSPLAAHGVKGIQLQGEDRVVSMVTWSNAIGSLLVVSQGGFAKQSPVHEYPLHGRGGKGVKTLHVTDFTGLVAGAILVTKQRHVWLGSLHGESRLLDVVDAPMQSRITQGLCLFPMAANDRVFAVRETWEWHDDLPTHPEDEEGDSWVSIDDEHRDGPGLQTIELVQPEMSSTDLVGALRRLRSGGTLRLGPGQIRIPKGLSISKPFTLVGAGAQKTQILCEHDEDELAAMQLCGKGPWIFVDLSVGFDLSAGDLPEEHGNDCVRVDSGQIEFARCRFHGASGSGLWLENRTRGRVSECQFDDNGCGIHSSGKVEVRFEKSHIHKNRDTGVWLEDQCTSVIRKCLIEDNGGDGIFVNDEASPTLEENQCLRNRESGIYFQEQSCGSVRRNVCHENGDDGIALFEEARPNLEGNVCSKNQGNGICYTDRSKGSAMNNDCHSNGGSGISASGTARPTLENNRCHKNGVYGIQFEEQSGGTASGNQCLDNPSPGIYVGPQSGAKLINNQIKSGEKAAKQGGPGRPDRPPEQTAPSLIVDQLLERGKQKGYLTHDEICESLSGLDVSPDFDALDESSENSDSSVEVVEDLPGASDGPELIELLQAKLSSDDLLQALRRLRPGGELRLGPATIRLSKEVHICKSVRLRGAGAEQTRIVCESLADQVAALHFLGDGPWTLEDLSAGFDAPEDPWPDDHSNWVVYAESGRLEITRCRLHGASGSGLYISAPEGRVAHCRIEENSFGILVGGESRMVLESNQIQSNWDCGVAVSDKATCTLRDNDCSGNDGVAGIWVSDEARPTLNNNRCLRNRSDGILIEGESQCIATDNQCLDNGGSGIKASGSALPHLESNLCRNNLHYGIWLDEQSGGQATRNQCEENGASGICAEGAQTHQLIENRCLRNGLQGISFAHQATGVARGNQCLENEFHGLVAPGSAVSLENNQCENNGLDTGPPRTELRKAYDKQTRERFANTIGQIYSPKWFDSFLNLLREMLLQLDLTSQDPRLSLSCPKSGGLNVTVGQRYVLTPESERCVAIIVPAGLEAEKFGGTLLYSFTRGGVTFTRGGVSDADCFQVPLDARTGLKKDIKQIWLGAVSKEMRRSKSSRYKKFHLPLFYDVAMNEELRKEILFEAYSSPGE